MRSREQTRIEGEKEKRMWKVRGTRRVHVFGSRSYRSGFRVDASAKKSSFWLSECTTRSGRKGTKRRGKNRVLFFLRLVGINKSSCALLTRLRLRRMRVDVPTNGTSETSECAMHTPVEIHFDSTHRIHQKVNLSEYASTVTKFLCLYRK